MLRSTNSEIAEMVEIFNENKFTYSHTHSQCWIYLAPETTKMVEIEFVTRKQCNLRKYIGSCAGQYLFWKSENSIKLDTIIRWIWAEVKLSCAAISRLRFELATAYFGGFIILSFMEYSVSPAEVGIQMLNLAHLPAINRELRVCAFTPI